MSADADAAGAGTPGGDDAHRPVMVAEVVRFLVEQAPRHDIVVDMTVGAGGHSEALLRAGVGRVIGVDRDPDAIALAQARLDAYGDRFRTARTTFERVDDRLVGGPVDGFLTPSEAPGHGLRFKPEILRDCRVGGSEMTAL